MSKVGAITIIMQGHIRHMAGMALNEIRGAKADHLCGGIGDTPPQ